MNRIAFLLCAALFATSLAHAQQDELSVRFAPGVSEIPDITHWHVKAYARANSNRAVYRAELQRREGGVFVDVPEDAPDGTRYLISSSTGEITVYSPAPAEYRLRVFASEGSGTPEWMVSKRFRVVASDAADWTIARDRLQIAHAYEWTLGCWQEYVAELRKRQFMLLDLSRDFESLMSPLRCYYWEDGFVYSDFRYGPPGWGEWVIAGQPGDGDATGAIVVTAPVMPTGPEDLHNLAVSVTMPAYAGVPGLERRTAQVAWEPGVVNPATAIANLALRIYPGGDAYALDGTPIPMWATVDGGKASFAFELERRDGTAWLHEESWQGDSMIHWQPRRAGQYRVRVTAVEEGSETLLETMRTFRVIGPRHADYDRLRAQNALDRNFEVAQAFVRHQLHAVKRKQYFRDDVTAEFNEFYELTALVAKFSDAAWGGAQRAAPGGGPALIAGVAGDGDATGAIVLNITGLPIAIDDWGDTTVQVTYPAYAPAGTQRRTVTVQYR